MFLEETLDPFDYALAEALGMSIGQLEEMPNAEYLQWRAFYEFRHAKQEQEAAHARR